MTTAGGFLRGEGAYREVELMDVLPPSLRGFSTQAQQEEFASDYETRTGVLVRFPWESEEARSQRRAGFKATPAAEIGGDPVRLRRSLDRVLAEIQNLTPDTPKYAEILATLAERANKFERSLGLKPTDFGIALVPAKQKDAEISPETLAKYKQFSGLSVKKRKESAEVTKDVEFLRLIRDRESAEEVVTVATLRLVALERQG